MALDDKDEPFFTREAEQVNAAAALKAMSSVILAEMTQKAERELLNGPIGAYEHMDAIKYGGRNKWAGFPPIHTDIAPFVHEDGSVTVTLVDGSSLHVSVSGWIAHDPVPYTGQTSVINLPLRPAPGPQV